MSLRQLPGQSKLAERLCIAIEKGRLSHAYLLLGPEGSGRFRLACALGTAHLCENRKQGDACGQCHSCKRIPDLNHPDAKNQHPDFHVYEPDAKDTQFKKDLVDQICADISLQSFEGRGKVFILKRAELFNVASANRFLKTLEEPPPGTLICMLAVSVHGLLPTIVSRCQTLRPLPVPVEEIVEVLVRDHAFKREDAMLAAHAADGWLDAALGLDKAFIGEVRRFLSHAAVDIRPQSNLEMTERLMQLCRDTADDKTKKVKKKEDPPEEEEEDPKEKGKEKKKEKSNLRPQVMRAVGMIRCLWSDALSYTVNGRPTGQPAAECVARQRTAGKLMEDLAAIGRTLEALRGNAGVDLALDVMFTEIATTQTSSPQRR